MFTRYAVEFAEVNTSLAITGAMVNLGMDTMVETAQGWTAIADLTAGDAVATLDGGFVPLAWVGDTQPVVDALFVPARALNNCSDIILPAETLVGIEAPLHFDAKSDHVSLPLAALEGLRGICKSDAALQFRTLGFASEEMIWAQTGMLVHARPMADGFFQTLRLAEARRLVSLVDAGHFDLPRAA
jgi:hypothetical protein